jgi:hypothetical protein
VKCARMGVVTAGVGVGGRGGGGGNEDVKWDLCGNNEEVTRRNSKGNGEDLKSCE